MAVLAGLTMTAQFNRYRIYEVKLINNCRRFYEYMVPRPDGHELSYFISALASAYVTIKRLKIEEEKRQRNIRNYLMAKMCSQNGCEYSRERKDIQTSSQRSLLDNRFS